MTELCKHESTVRIHPDDTYTVGDVFEPLPWFQTRYRKEHAQQRSTPSLPLVENLLKDNTDGCALTTLLHFYCSQVVRLEGENPQLAATLMTTPTLFYCHYSKK